MLILQFMLCFKVCDRSTPGRHLGLFAEDLWEGRALAIGLAKQATLIVLFLVDGRHGGTRCSLMQCEAPEGMGKE